MAIIVHSSSKNAHPAKVLEYYTQVHKEDLKTGKYTPVLDANGLRQERKNCKTIYKTPSGQDAPLEQWITDYYATNRRYGKNRSYEEVKTHEFIISFREEDSQKLPLERLEYIGRQFVNRYCSGHSALISIHWDTDNYHIHITINSVRGFRRQEREWMISSTATGNTLRCETEAGGKYQDSNELKRARNDWILSVCKQYGLALEDNNKTSDQRKEKRHSEKNMYLRDACLECGSYARDFSELAATLWEKYRIVLTITGKTISVQHPDSLKAVRLDTVRLEPADLCKNMGQDIFEAYQEEYMRRKYFQWILERHKINEERAQRTYEKMQQMLCETKGLHYKANDFKDLNYLLKQCTYVVSALQIELEKIERIKSRWDAYLAQAAPDHKKAGAYVRWCGCDPDSQQEYAALLAMRETTLLQQQSVESMSVTLLKTADMWRHSNKISRVENDLHWQVLRQKKLKHQLKYVRESRKRLKKIVENCGSAIDGRYLWRYTFKAAHQLYLQFGVWPVEWQSFGRMYLKYQEALKKEEQLIDALDKTKLRIRETKSEKKDLKAKID